MTRYCRPPLRPASVWRRAWPPAGRKSSATPGAASASSTSGLRRLREAVPGVRYHHRGHRRRRPRQPVRRRARVPAQAGIRPGSRPPPAAPPTGPPPVDSALSATPFGDNLGPRQWDRWRRWTLAAATAAWAARLERQMIGRLRHSDEEDSRYTESLDGDSTAMVIATVFLTQGLAQLLCPPRSSSPRPAHCPAPPGDGFPSGHRRHAHRSRR